MAEFIPPIRDDEQLRISRDPHEILVRVVHGLIFDNPRAVKTFRSQGSRVVEALALFGNPIQQTVSLASGERGGRRGYHYAYQVDDGEHNESRVGLIIANPVIMRGPQFALDRTKTLRQYSTDIYSERRKTDALGFDLAPDAVLRTDYSSAIAIGTIALESELERPFGAGVYLDDAVTRAFKADINTAIYSTPVRPLTDLIHKVLDL